MQTIEIRKSNLTDLTELQAISKQTFVDTFGDQNTADDMQEYVERNLSLERLERELKDSNAEFYFAILGHKIIGYLKINFGQSQTELKDNSSLEIERVYVLKEFHGKNVGKMLLEKALEIARKQNVEYVWLGVWENNARAIRFYQKYGFEEFDKHIFLLGTDEQTDLMMRLKLS